MKMANRHFIADMNKNIWNEGIAIPPGGANAEPGATSPATVPLCLEYFVAQLTKCKVAIAG